MVDGGFAEDVPVIFQCQRPGPDVDSPSYGIIGVIEGNRNHINEGIQGNDHQAYHKDDIAGIEYFIAQAGITLA
ncbi:hypothetical protein D3C73_1610260 [compost metagenome]